MKQFLIKYTRTAGSEDEWRSAIGRFIAALQADADLSGRIAYRCLKRSGGDDYYHLATTADETAAAALQTRDWFKRYSEGMRAVAGGKVEVIPLELVGETEGSAG
jgi:hypothetical protein